MNSESIVAAAVRMVDEDGLDALTMRRLAGALGVSPMSLYRHVNDKDDLLDQLLDMVIGQFRAPAASEDDWGDQVAAFFDRFRQLLVDHPGVARLVATRAPRSPAWFRWIDQALGLIRAGGLEGVQAVNALTALLLYTMGFVLWELPPSPTTSLADWERLRLARLLGLLSDELPNVAELAPHLVHRATPEQFAWGLERLIAALPRDPREEVP
jgi:AcrR family transcriptional regulator